MLSWIDSVDFLSVISTVTLPWESLANPGLEFFISQHGGGLIFLHSFFTTNAPEWKLRELLATCSLGSTISPQIFRNLLVEKLFWLSLVVDRFTICLLSDTQRGEDEENKQQHAEAGLAQLWPSRVPVATSGLWESALSQREGLQNPQTQQEDPLPSTVSVPESACLHTHRYCTTAQMEAHYRVYHRLRMGGKLYVLFRSSDILAAKWHCFHKFMLY